MNYGCDKLLSFGTFRLYPAERLLFDGDKVVTLPPKVFDTLRLLVENPGHVLSKERMLDDIWEGSFVEENNLAQNISILRKLLGENDQNKYIETVPKYGYRFVARVRTDRDPKITTEVIESARARIFVGESSGDIATELPISANTPALVRHRPKTHYVQNGDVNIAYQVVGSGPIDIVFVMGWVSHLEYFWKGDLFAAFLDRLASFSRLILFDKRGTGLSDHVPLKELPTLEQRMDDVRAVMDAVGSESAVLFGVSEGGPMCSLFAATYPERTRGLVMFGTYAKRIKEDDDYPWAPTIEQRNTFFEIVKRDWGKAVGIEERAPSMADNTEFREWWAEYLRMGASPGAAVALTKMNAEIDVREVLPLVQVPTLVIHRTGDMCLKVEEGRFVASKIPGAKYVEFDGIDHLPFVGEQDEMFDEIERFVTGVRFAGEYDRVLATVMSISFADAGKELGIRGDKGWTNFVESSKRFVHRQLALFKGREVSVGDEETLAAFDGPARSIRCALAIKEAAEAQGISLCIGLHTGECDVVGDTYSGFAVELARRIRSTSVNGNIIVSRTVKDLVAGSGLEFTEFGPHIFDGIEGEWRLFTVNG